mmetsp:Transcript_17501/g.24044  ORF Transcript_17501/g.24044 Transcript_17501/m.24044 type:complete len:206 (-) Transcript_17501:494-1111(-)
MPRTTRLAATCRCGATRARSGRAGCACRPSCTRPCSPQRNEGAPTTGTSTWPTGCPRWWRGWRAAGPASPCRRSTRWTGWTCGRPCWARRGPTPGGRRCWWGCRGRTRSPASTRGTPRGRSLWGSGSWCTMRWRPPRTRRPRRRRAPGRRWRRRAPRPRSRRCTTSRRTRTRRRTCRRHTPSCMRICSGGWTGTKGARGRASSAR